jgi:Arc/MetJ-type ribon-helix-helix transcriptional regulator
MCPAAGADRRSPEGRAMTENLPAIPFAQGYVEPILAGDKTVTFRRHRDGFVRVIDGLGPGDRVQLTTTDGENIDTATIVTRSVVPAWQLARLSFAGHRSYDDYNELGRDLERHYEDWTVGSDTPIEVLAFLPDSVATGAEEDGRRRYGASRSVDDREDEPPAKRDPEICADGGQIIPERSLWAYDAVVHGANVDPCCLAITGSGKPCTYTAYGDAMFCGTHKDTEDPEVATGAHQWALISDDDVDVAVCTNCYQVWYGGNPATAVDCPECSAEAGQRCRDDSSNLGGKGAAHMPHPERREIAREQIDGFDECDAWPLEDDDQAVATDGGRPVGAADAGAQVPHDDESGETELVSVRVPEQLLEKVDERVEAGEFRDRTAAIVGSINRMLSEPVACTDGGDGAIDSDWEDAERSPREILEANVQEALDGTLESPVAGDVAFDLVTRQPLFVRGVAAEDLVEYYEAEEFDLASYKVHPWLPGVDLDNAVLECSFLGSIDDVHSQGKTYDYPEGRLVRIPVELAGGDGS